MVDCGSAAMLVVYIALGVALGLFPLLLLFDYSLARKGDDLLRVLRARKNDAHDAPIGYVHYVPRPIAPDRLVVGQPIAPARATDVLWDWVVIDPTGRELGRIPVTQATFDQLSEMKKNGDFLADHFLYSGAAQEAAKTVFPACWLRPRARVDEMLEPSDEHAARYGYDIMLPEPYSRREHPQRMWDELESLRRGAKTDITQEGERPRLGMADRIGQWLRRLRAQAGV